MYRVSTYLYMCIHRNGYFLATFTVTKGCDQDLHFPSNHSLLFRYSTQNSQTDSNQS